MRNWSSPLTQLPFISPARITGRHWPCMERQILFGYLNPLSSRLTLLDALYRAPPPQSIWLGLKHCSHNVTLVTSIKRTVYLCVLIIELKVPYSTASQNAYIITPLLCAIKTCESPKTG